jgi:hypothetical protein
LDWGGDPLHRLVDRLRAGRMERPEAPGLFDIEGEQKRG